MKVGTIKILAILLILGCSSCASVDIAKNDLNNQPYFPGCATITSQCDL